jgi:aspartyl-tRNA(Asn)/glutamyl-tRNA(Gln) amidotransferase subunit A
MTSLPSALEIARRVRDGETTAVATAESALDRIAALDATLNAFTDVTAERALREAAAVDADRAAGRPLGPLAGAPYAVKNLFDLEGLTTRAGSKINRERPPAARDADLVGLMRAAGAVCLGALNMGEFAYDFTGENAHDGACRNPHDTDRMPGGSSSGSGAATAAGLVPISLGSDTNGSIRVPAALCGLFALRPTYGRLSRGGTFPFVDSLDTLGPFARTVGDLTAAYAALQGTAARDHAWRGLPPERPTLEAPARVRIGVARGWIERNAGEAALAARDAAVRALGGTVVDLDLDGAEAGRAAAYLITNAESSAFHLETLRRRAADYDPDTRDRFLAGALLPAAWVLRAQRVRKWWLERLLAAFDRVDVIMAPATPTVAPRLGDRTLVIGGVERPLRPSLGLLAQPFSCVGVPVVTVPTFEAGALPLGVQIVAPPWRENMALAMAARLESEGFAVAHPPPITAPKDQRRN